MATHAPERYEFIGYDNNMESSAQQQWLETQADSRPIVFRSNSLDVQQAAARASVGLAAYCRISLATGTKT